MICATLQHTTGMYLRTCSDKGGKSDDCETRAWGLSITGGFLRVDDRCSSFWTFFTNGLSLDIGLASKCDTYDDSGVT